MGLFIPRPWMPSLRLDIYFVSDILREKDNRLER